jgi:hypothetical protein
MKYFTKELWGAQSSQAWTQWAKNSKAYYAQLTKLRPRLTKSAWHFFSKVSLHDGTLLLFLTGDHISENPKSLKSRTWHWIVNKRQPIVQLQVLHENLRTIYHLEYRELRKVVFDHPTLAPLDLRYKNPPIVDWGYAELTSANKESLRHEILFSSGASILIEFRRFSYKKVSVKRPGK